MSALDMHQVADDLHHAINGIDGELRNLDTTAAPRDTVLARCREHLDILRRISGEIADDINPTPYGGNAMNNIDRATEHMDSLDRLYAYGSGQEPSNAERAQALADAGYLMPDLPEPTDKSAPEWESPSNEYHAVSATTYGTVRIWGSTSGYTPKEARGIALALLAAADHAERKKA